MALVNQMEPIVREMLDEYLAKTDCCKCNMCYNDMLAIILNNLKPRYVNTHEGELLAKLESVERQPKVDISIAIIKAIEIVQRHPHKH